MQRRRGRTWRGGEGEGGEVPEFWSHPTVGVDLYTKYDLL